MLAHPSVRDLEPEERQDLAVPPSALDEYLDNPPDASLWPKSREECGECGKRGRFYCPDCLVFVGKPDNVDVPLGLRLPLQVCVWPCVVGAARIFLRRHSTICAANQQVYTLYKDHRVVDMPDLYLCHCTPYPAEGRDSVVVLLP